MKSFVDSLLSNQQLRDILLERNGFENAVPWNSNYSKDMTPHKNLINSKNDLKFTKFL